MTREEFESWKSNRLTREVTKRLMALRDDHTSQAEKACLSYNTCEQIALSNTLNAGICLGLTEFIDLEWEDTQYED